MFADVYMLCVCSRSVYNKQGNYKCLQILLTGSTLHTHTHTHSWVHQGLEICFDVHIYQNIVDDIQISILYALLP